MKGLLAGDMTKSTPAAIVQCNHEDPSGGLKHRLLLSHYLAEQTNGVFSYICKGFVPLHVFTRLHPNMGPKKESVKPDLTSNNPGQCLKWLGLQA